MDTVSSLVANYVRSSLASPISQQAKTALPENMVNTEKSKDQEKDSSKSGTMRTTPRSSRRGRTVANDIIDCGAKRTDQFTEFFSLSAQLS